MSKDKNKKRYFLLLLLIVSSVCVLPAQNADSSLVSLSNFKLFPGTFSWRGTDTFHDMTSWDSRPYQEGNLREQSGSRWFFRMNYRLLFPASYAPNYEKGYPVLIFLHGAGERGNCWEKNCYCEGCNSNGTPDPSAAPEFLNNDHMLMLGGQPFLNAVNLAGAKKADDPTLNPLAFPGFVVFPQNESFWGSADGANSPVSYALRILRLLVREHNIDPERIYIAGLSMGGQGVLKALSMADWLFAAAIAMSPVPYQNSYDYEGAVRVPLWIFQGGYDEFPRPAQTEALISKIRATGGTVRYTFYPQAGHNTWNKAFREPEFFSWLLKRKKTDVHVAFGNSAICSTRDDGQQLTVTPGFAAYQWERDGKTIEGATTHEYIAKEEGVYRARFSYKANPAEGEWNEWSGPVELKLYTPKPPELLQRGTTFLPDLNGGNQVVLLSPTNAEHYVWERNGSDAGLPDSSIVAFTGKSGEYRLRVKSFDQCPSASSASKPVFFSNSAPVDNSMRPGTLTAEPLSSSEVYLSWNDPSPLESGFEVWRIRTADNSAKWELAAITRSGVSFFRDSLLIPGSSYGYKVRAISTHSRSDYFPSPNPLENVVVSLKNENFIPSPPQNLTVKRIGVTEFLLEWDPGKDESGIREYLVTCGEKSIRTGSASATSVLINDLRIDQLYTAKVQTSDITGNLSTPSNQVTFSTSMNGLFYKHSTGAWNSLDEEGIRSTWKNPEHRGQVANLTLAPRVQEDYFNFEFDGYLNIPTTGTYEFFLNSNDGSRLYLDGNRIIDFDGHHGLCRGNATNTSCPNGWGKPSGKLNLAAGFHRIRVEMFEYTGPQDLFLRYNGPATSFTTVAVPDAAFTSGRSASGAVPPAPLNLSATSPDMSTINLKWSTSSPAEYEIYRAVSASGPFSIISRVTALAFSDKALTPGKTYYYRVRAVTGTGASAFSSTVSTATVADREAPTVPQELAAESGNQSRVILKWKQSTDNDAVAGYEIWANNRKIGMSSVPGFVATPLEPGELYEFYVVAVDRSGNRSGKSAVVNNESFYTSLPEVAASFNLTVYPNPATENTLSIKADGLRPGQVLVQIHDSAFRLIYSSRLQAGGEGIEHTISLAGSMAVGQYFISLSDGRRTETTKVIISR